MVKIADQEPQIIPFGSVDAPAIVADTFTVAAALLLRHLSLVPSDGLLQIGISGHPG